MLARLIITPEKRALQLSSVEGTVAYLSLSSPYPGQNLHHNAEIWFFPKLGTVRGRIGEMPSVTIRHAHVPFRS